MLLCYWSPACTKEDWSLYCNWESWHSADLSIVRGLTSTWSSPSQGGSSIICRPSAKCNHVLPEVGQDRSRQLYLRVALIPPVDGEQQKDSYAETEMTFRASFVFSVGTSCPRAISAFGNLSPVFKRMHKIVVQVTFIEQTGKIDRTARCKKARMFGFEEHLDLFM